MPACRTTVLFAGLLAAALSLASVADAQYGKDGKSRDGGPSAGRPPPEIIGAFSPKRANLADMRARGFRVTGLQAAYPDGADCPKIDSPFASGTRFDGTMRNERFFNGLHGGADISAPGGTPLLAIADGTVVRLHEGGNIGGISLFLQHAPEDTGLPVWLYTEYKHLEAMPPLQLGQRVRRGEVVARVGNTGTTGGRAYGPAGHYHLHWTAFYSASPDYTSRRMFVPKDGYWMDPLAVFLGDPLASDAVAALPQARRRVAIAYRTSDGETVPADAKIIWPLACAPR